MAPVFGRSYDRGMKKILLASVLGALLVGCAGLETFPSTAARPADPQRRDSRLVDAATGAPVSLDRLADTLAQFDAVILGEFHDSDAVHRFQIELTRRLLERRGAIAISLEQFERDDQGTLDRYLAGEIDEAQFRDEARFWPNYDEHYRPAIELARKRGQAVIAGNIPRPLAARVVKEGMGPVLAAEFAPRQAHAFAGEYRRRFTEVMGGHASEMGWTAIANVFAAQCIKDDAMAESISDHLNARSRPWPIVVHWCGAFHSDYRLGTVERLQLRMPGLRIAVISPLHVDDFDHELTAEERTQGEWILLVRE